MDPHQSGKCRGLVRGVVIDVHVGAALATVVHEVDESLKSNDLGFAVLSPIWAVCRRPILVSPENTEEELKPGARVKKRITFHIKEEITSRRRGQEPQTPPLLGSEQAVPEFAAPVSHQLEA